MYSYKCEYCDGVVKEQLIEKEAFKHKRGFVIFENVPVGICDKCGYHYYNSKILHIVDEIARGKRVPEGIEAVPVGHLG